MDLKNILGILAVLVAILSGGFFFLFLLRGRQQNDVRSLMGSRISVGVEDDVVRAASDPGLDSTRQQEVEFLKAEAKRRAAQGHKYTLEEKFFQAGMFTDGEKKRFHTSRIVYAVITVTILTYICWVYLGADLAIVGVILGGLIGYQLPFSVLDRKIAYRAEEIMFYLPLVIEQIAIGVSSSLDVAPCLEKVVTMADERDTHNVVTELIAHAQYYVRSGVALQEALTEVGRLSGHVELKHAFMSLAQVAKHGGEISRQLQELADAVAMQRETRIEERIKKLELEATGPVALVFFGFIIILLTGFGLQMQSAFG